MSGTTQVSQYQKEHLVIFWIFWCKMKITQADAPTIQMDCHPIQTNWCPHLGHLYQPSPPFLYRMPFLIQPSQFIMAWDRHQICWLAYPVAYMIYPETSWGSHHHLGHPSVKSGNRQLSWSSCSGPFATLGMKRGQRRLPLALKIWTNSPVRQQMGSPLPWVSTQSRNLCPQERAATWLRAQSTAGSVRNDYRWLLY